MRLTAARGASSTRPVPSVDATQAIELIVNKPISRRRSGRATLMCHARRYITIWTMRIPTIASANSWEVSPVAPCTDAARPATKTIWRMVSRWCATSSESNLSA